MPDFDQFERTLGAALRADADRRVPAVDASIVARTAIGAGSPRPLRWRLPWAATIPGVRPGWRTFLVVAAVAGALALAGVIAVGAVLKREAPISPDRAITLMSETDGLVDVDPTTGLVRSTPGCVGECLVGEGPRWSPDGTRLAYLAENAVWVTDIATGASRRLAICCTDPNALNGWPHAAIDWSPDGRRVAFGDGHRIFTIDADGGEPVAVTPEVLVGDASQPAWSPDGSRLAFTWRGDPPGIYTIRLDGTDMRPVAVSRDVPPTSPGWAPDGSRIAYLTDPASPRAFTANLWTVRPDGTDARVLFQVPGCCVSDWGDLSWSKDGTRIATILGPGFGRLYVVSAAEGTPSEVADHVRPGAIAWRPAQRCGAAGCLP